MYFTNVDDLISAAQKGETDLTLEMPDEVKNDPEKNLAEIRKLTDFILQGDTHGLKLSLVDQKISEEGIALIASAISFDPNGWGEGCIEYLDISRNSISDKSLQVIAANLLERNTKKIESDQTDNAGWGYVPSSDWGISDSSDSVKGSGIRQLIIRGDNNSFTDEGFHSLAESISSCGNLSGITISSRGITAASLRDCEDIFRRNLTMESKSDFASRQVIHLDVKGSDEFNENFTELEKRYAASKVQIDDMVEDFAKSIVGAKFVRAAPHHADTKDYSKKVFGALNDVPRSFTRDLMSQTKQILFKGLSLEQIEKFSACWHLPGRQVATNKLKDYSDAPWESLFGKDAAGNVLTEIAVPQEIAGVAGWKLVVRTTAQELKKEGEDLGHCVGGYVDKCLNGRSHIISIVDEQGKSMSTIEIELDPKEKETKVIQHYGKDNQLVSEVESAVAKWFLDYAKSNEIINYEELEEARAVRAFSMSGDLREKSINYLGFNAFDDAKAGQVFLTFRDKIIPNGSLSILGVKANFEELAQLETIMLESGIVHLMPMFTQRAKVEEKRAEPKKTQTPEELLKEIQENIDKIFGEGLVSAAIVGKDERSFGNVELSSNHYSAEILFDIIGNASEKFKPNNKSSQNSAKILIEGLKPKPVGLLLKKVLEDQPDISNRVQAMKKTEDEKSTLHPHPHPHPVEIYGVKSLLENDDKSPERG